MDVLTQLRSKVDGSDNFIFGHSVGGVPGTSYATRIANTPQWVHDDVQVRALISKIFPKWQTNEKQKISAGRWMGVIHHYFRQGLTSRETAQHMGLSHEFVRITVFRIKKAHDNGRPRGRPKK